MSTTIVPMHQAKSSLSKLVKRAAGGEIIFIGSYGRAEAVLTSAASAKPKKRLGLLEGKLTVPDDFDASLPPELLASFEGHKE
ncbi:MAG: type II toxin-antitoxin system prevent-host-death family antitoxin [Deltaproteobacteria bacterium]|jgi:antitoxin (DNA-binding transcriptional repressor) of toxin-antitoxin stability system|nr:type II toxin-antitoxin system prevent-host-death family antitoxin [Deltaproteobacteria bacterium]